jgi:hypothetical protein
MKSLCLFTIILLVLSCFINLEEISLIRKKPKNSHKKILAKKHIKSHLDRAKPLSFEKNRKPSCLGDKNESNKSPAILWNGWVKFIHYCEDVPTKPKTFFNNNKFFLQTLEKSDMKLMNRGFIIIPSKLHFYLKLLKDKLIFKFNNKSDQDTSYDELLVKNILPLDFSHPQSSNIKSLGDFTEGSCVEIFTKNREGTPIQPTESNTREIWVICLEDKIQREIFLESIIKAKLESQKNQFKIKREYIENHLKVGEIIKDGKLHTFNKNIIKNESQFLFKNKKLSSLKTLNFSKNFTSNSNSKNFLLQSNTNQKNVSSQPIYTNTCDEIEGDIFLLNDSELRKGIFNKVRIIMNVKSISIFNDLSLKKTLLNFPFHNVKFYTYPNNNCCFNLVNGVNDYALCESLERTCTNKLNQWEREYKKIKECIHTMEVPLSEVKSSNFEKLKKNENLERIEKSKKIVRNLNKTLDNDEDDDEDDDDINSSKNISSKNKKCKTSKKDASPIDALDDLMNTKNISEKSKKLKSQLEDEEKQRRNSKICKAKKDSEKALKKETKLEKLMQEELELRSEQEEKELLEKKKYEEKRTKVLMDIIEAKAKEQLRLEENKISESKIEDIKQSTRQKIKERRQELKRKLLEIKIQAEKKKKQIEKEIEQIRKRIADNNNQSKQNLEIKKCVQTMTCQMRINDYCDQNFESFDDLIKCRERNYFCYMCCDKEIAKSTKSKNQIFSNSAQKKMKCYQLCDRIKNLKKKNKKF